MIQILMNLNFRKVFFQWTPNLYTVERNDVKLQFFYIFCNFRTMEFSFSLTRTLSLSNTHSLTPTLSHSLTLSPSHTLSFSLLRLDDKSRFKRVHPSTRCAAAYLKK